MIICQLQGGLGNQMFQYAMARSLALETRQDLFLDRSRTVLSKDRRYALGAFQVHQTFAAPFDVILFSLPFHEARKTILKKLNWKIINEPHFHYSEVKINPRQKNYVKGYWQSYKYFQTHEKEIGRDFTFKSAPVGENAEVLEKIHNSNSVCLHVRRGDYVVKPAANQTHGLCGLDYYKRAVERLGEAAPNPHFFIFSDDPEWTKNNIQTGFPTTYVSHNSGPWAHEDLRLMSACRHFIIANSSLSWWGAWLSSNHEKIVVAPKVWFANNSFDDKDLIPENWQRL